MPPPKIPLSMVWYYHKRLLLVIPVYLGGKFLDDIENTRLTRFRDKSALYGGKVKPGDPPSW